MGSIIAGAVIAVAGNDEAVVMHMHILDIAAIDRPYPQAKILEILAVVDVRPLMRVAVVPVYLYIIRWAAYGVLDHYTLEPPKLLPLLSTLSLITVPEPTNLKWIS